MPVGPRTYLLLLALLGGCAEYEAGAGGGTSVGGFGFGGGVNSGGGLGFGGEGGGSLPPGPFTYTALCGVDQCVPGGLTPCTPEPGAGGSGGMSGLGGAAGTGGGSAGGGSNTGGAGGAGGVAGGGFGGGGGAPATNYGCQITDDGRGPLSVCEATGSAIIDGVCNSSSDCLPGLGCVLAATEVGDGGGPPAPPVGICRPYCCGDLEGCPQDTFCAPKPLFDAAAALEDPTTAIPIPVCMPITGCQLLGTDCPDGETCSVVRADGSTSCVPVGRGTLCQPCECAAGFICNFGTGLCMQLCDTATNDCPGEGALCEGGTGLPDAVGICIGGDSACE